MELIIISFLAGFLTVLAPCILPLLPVIVGGSLTGGTVDVSKTLRIVLSLAISVTVFTLLLKASTSLLGVPQEVWRSISGGLVIFVGLTFLVPSFWDALGTKLNGAATRTLGQGTKRHDKLGDIVIGAALGPVFTSCSPVYGLLIAAVLPASFVTGTFYIVLYALGLSFALLLIATAGQALTSKLKWASDPHGRFRKILGLVFILIGVSVLFGWDKLAEAWLLERGFYDGTTGLEQFIK